jgi:predicted RNase H-like nuclease
MNAPRSREIHLPTAGSRVVGVDGARSGWIAVADGSPTFVFHVFSSPSALFKAFEYARVIAVDIPIGLADRSSRAPDALARKFVGGRRACSIFSAPVRGILDAQSQPEASRRHRAIDGRGFGAQSFGILPKIREWDALLRLHASARERIYEIHPEVSFAALNGGVGLILGKKTSEGAQLRAELLGREFGAEAVQDLLSRVPRREAAPDDVLDALVALWTARRIARGEAESLPSPPCVDSEGLRMAIYY